MAFALSGFNRVSSGANTEAPVAFAYISSADTLATIKGSAYFNSLVPDLTNGIGTLKVADIIFAQGSDNAGLIRVTAVTTNVTVEDLIGPGDIAADDIALAEGLMMVGAATGRATTIDASAGGNILIGNDTTMVALDGSTDTQILVGNGTTMTSVAVSGDATLANTGALTIAAGAVEESMIEANSLTGLVVENVADVNQIGGIPVVHTINTAGGATADTSITLTHKTRVVWMTVQNNGAGTASDTIQLFNGVTSISNAVDISGADESVAVVGTIADSTATVAAAGTLKVTETDGGGSDSPATTVTIYGVRVA